MDPEQTSGRPGLLWWLLPLLVLLSGLLITTLIAPQSQVPVETLTAEVSRTYHELLSRTLARRTSDTLTAARRLDAREPRAFRKQANEFLQAFPEVAGLELLDTVSHAQRGMVERQLSDQSGQFIRFATWSGPFQSEPAGPAERYLVIRQAVFRQDVDPGTSSLGLVATSVPHWRNALKLARQDNRATATTETILHRHGSEQRAVRVFIPVERGRESDEDYRLIALAIRPQPWLQQQLADLHDPRWQIQIHDISQYARHPLAMMPSATPPASDMPATRSTLNMADRQWMLSTRPAAGWLDRLRQQALWPPWLTGLALTLLASALTLWAGWRLTGLERHLTHRTRRTRHLGQQLDNTRVEKSILHHSLQESDRRARDLIELGAGIFAELDEGRHIGYISPQVATLLDAPSTELVGTPLDVLFPEAEHRDLSMTFDAARRDQGIQRLDTEVMTRAGVSLPIALRVKALKDPLSGCAGFRVSLTPRD